MAGMRILVTGLGTFWGSRLAQALEQIDGIETIVGLDTREPRLPLERTEFVRADSNYSILDRIVRATKVDTVLHTHLIVDSTEISGRALHEINVIGTMNLLAAAGAAGSPVRKVVVKSSSLMYGSNYKDPYFFRETMPRTRPPRTRVERSLLDAAAFVRDFAIDNPHMTVTKLRFTNVLGSDITTTFSNALRLPVVPEIFGYDPRLQFTHEDDVTGALLHATLKDVPGIYNIAGDGTMPWSEVCAVVGKRRVALPPLLTQWAAEPLRMLRIVDLPPEVLSLLRYGRGIDNSPFKQTGFHYRYSTAGTVDAFARSLRLERAVGDSHPAYKFERDVETFFRHSPAVVRND
jgi:UDP-glucose 4-epimerase